VHAPPLKVPQRPSAAQVPETHALGLAQLPPLRIFAEQAPVLSQNELDPHWLSAVQALAQLPLTHAPPRQLAPLTHWPPAGTPQMPSVPHTPEAHCEAVVHGWCGGELLGAEGKHWWLAGSQKVPVPHCALEAQEVAQPPLTSSQMPLRHWLGELQGWVAGTPQRPATQRFDWHWPAELHALPLSRRGAQAPFEQNVEAVHSLSLVHASQVPAAHAESRHWLGDEQLSPRLAPH
jgi:hypothetical protein